MNKEEFANWIERIKKILRIDNESEEFIEFLVSWFRSMKGKHEIELLQTYHPDFIYKSEEEVFEFIQKARYFIEDMSEEEFKIQLFDSAFFLYRPCLKSKFMLLEKD